METKKTILLIEDDAVTAMVTSSILESFGYKVVHTNTGEKGVRIALENKSLLLVISDINLGSKMNGLEAARQIREKRNIPIIFLTSHSDDEHRSLAHDISPHGYVVKHSQNSVLLSTIQRALKQKDAYTKNAEPESLRQLTTQVD